MAEGLSRSRWLKTIYLQHNGISDMAAQGFAEALGRSNVFLEHLDLSYNRINDSGGELLAMCLKSNTSLCKLNLKKNNLEDSSGRMFVSYLAVNH